MTIAKGDVWRIRLTEEVKMRVLIEVGNSGSKGPAHGSNPDALCERSVAVARVVDRIFCRTTDNTYWSYDGVLFAIFIEVSSGEGALLRGWDLIVE